MKHGVKTSIAFILTVAILLSYMPVSAQAPVLTAEAPVEMKENNEANLVGGDAQIPQTPSDHLEEAVEETADVSGDGAQALAENEVPMTADSGVQISAENEPCENMQIPDDLDAYHASCEEKEDAVEKEVYVLHELVEKREANTKHFRMSDGTTKAYVYSGTVHYRDAASGTYKDIDNRLSLVTEGEEKYYENKENAFRVKLPESIGVGSVEFSDANGYVRFRLSDAENGEIIKSEEQEQSEDKTDVIGVNSKLTYKSVKKGVDVEYLVTGDALKETIILNENTADSFVYQIETDAASVTANEDGTISFCDAEGNCLYVLQSPYMTDSAGMYSAEVKTALEKTETGYALTYTPDQQWLSEPTREYPVKIDPTIVAYATNANVVDTYGLWSAAAGALSFGVADVGGPTCKTLKQIFTQPIKEIGKQAINDLSMTAAISAGTFLNGTKMNALRTSYKTTVDRRERAAMRFSTWNWSK